MLCEPIVVKLDEWGVRLEPTSLVSVTAKLLFQMALGRRRVLQTKEMRKRSKEEGVVTTFVRLCE